ncbi:hypothetical protein V500_06939 [Pseudogymnoascus sp. VKM F-4518 (FW-2643)]|nr:hypothetical protein V500_06939 [Pseudogymnoascus sp. VKM F-4518 (FW-2643)]
MLRSSSSSSEILAGVLALDGDQGNVGDGGADILGDRGEDILDGAKKEGTIEVHQMGSAYFGSLVVSNIAGTVGAMLLNRLRCVGNTSGDLQVMLKNGRCD